MKTKTLEKLLNGGKTASTVVAERISEEWKLFPNKHVLKQAIQLKETGHLVIPAYKEMCGSMVLYALGLNPMHPIEFGLPMPAFIEKSTADSNALYFYISSLPPHRHMKWNHFQPLQVLDKLQAALTKKQRSMEQLTQSILASTDVTELFNLLIHPPSNKPTPYFLTPAIIQHLKNNFQPHSFRNLVLQIHQSIAIINPEIPNNDPYLLAEIYMDVLLEGWREVVG
jgi:hypothetical protein